jgi:hypothetical protein
LQVIRLSAFPEQVTTGRFATGDIAQIEKKLYEECPSAAAHLVTEIALYGEFTSQRGLQILLPAEELHPDGESHDPIGNNGTNRSYASQLFQHVSLNLYYSRAGMKAHYRSNPANDSAELITQDGRSVPVDASARSVSMVELCAEIAGDPGSRR